MAELCSSKGAKVNGALRGEKAKEDDEKIRTEGNQCFVSPEF